VVAALGKGATEAIEQTTAREMEELHLAEKKYRVARDFPDLRARTVLLVDDGLATGATMRAAVRAVRQHRPASVIVAVPVAAESSCRELQGEADRVICGLTPRDFFGVGQFYENFSQTSDEEVRELLERAAAEMEKSQPNE